MPKSVNQDPVVVVVTKGKACRSCFKIHFCSLLNISTMEHVGSLSSYWIQIQALFVVRRFVGRNFWS